MGIKASDIVFGPFNDLILGKSVGLNLHAGVGGACIHNCAYCNLSVSNQKKPQLSLEPYQVVESLIAAVEGKEGEKKNLDSIVITGGGNPIDHPKFPEIIKDVMLVRDLIRPETKVVVVTSGHGIERPEVLLALQLVDLCILRFDPVSIKGHSAQSHAEFKKYLKRLKGNIAVQACLETTNLLLEDEVSKEQKGLDSWVQDVVSIGARQAYLCAADRDVLDSDVPFFPKKRLSHIVNLLNAQNIRTQVV